jgi:translation initiation factor IF-2
MGDLLEAGPGDLVVARPTPPRPAASPPGAPRPGAPRPTPVPSRARPDPNPVRLMVGFVGLASVSAIATGLLPSVRPPAAADPARSITIVADAAPLPVRHVTRYVQLKPGQTAPPKAAVVAAPNPTPRIVVVTTTRQSGKP